MRGEGEIEGNEGGGRGGEGELKGEAAEGGERREARSG